jgi:hypothetical protein
MSKRFLLVLPMALTAGGLMVSTPFTFGKTEKDKKGCTCCRTEVGRNHCCAEPGDLRQSGEK